MNALGPGSNALGPGSNALGPRLDVLVPCLNGHVPRLAGLEPHLNGPAPCSSEMAKETVLFALGLDHADAVRARSSPARAQPIAAQKSVQCSPSSVQCGANSGQGGSRRLLATRMSGHSMRSLPEFSSGSSLTPPPAVGMQWRRRPAERSPDSPAGGSVPWTQTLPATGWHSPPRHRASSSPLMLGDCDRWVHRWR